MKLLRRESLAWLSRIVFGVLFLLVLGALMWEFSQRGDPGYLMLLNSLIVALPLVVLFVAADVLAEALEQHLMMRHISRRLGALMRWTPRIGMMVFAFFISLFALDIFGQGYSLWETIVGLTMHLIPTFALLAVLAVAWRWPLVGGITTLLAAGVFLLRFGANWGGEWTTYLLILGPPIMIGLMFLADWWLRAEVEPTPDMPATSA